MSDLLQSICTHFTTAYHATAVVPAGEVRYSAAGVDFAGSGSYLKGALRIGSHAEDDVKSDWFLEVGLRALADGRDPVRLCLTMHSGTEIKRFSRFDAYGREGFNNFREEVLLPEIRRLPNGMPHLMEVILDSLDTHIDGFRDEDDEFDPAGDGFHLMRGNGSWVKVFRCPDVIPLSDEALKKDRFWYSLAWWGPVNTNWDNVWSVDVSLGVRVVHGRVVPEDGIVVVVEWYAALGVLEDVLVETVADLAEWEDFVNGPLAEFKEAIDASVDEDDLMVDVEDDA